MSSLSLTGSRLLRGVWRGLLTGSPPDSPPPRVVARHMGDRLEDVMLARGDGGWLIEVPVPPAAISDGVHVLTLSDAETGMRLGHVTLVAGKHADDDLRTEVELLRAELDLLKRAFRRHCDETAG